MDGCKRQKDRHTQGQNGWDIVQNKKAGKSMTINMHSTQHQSLDC